MSSDKIDITESPFTPSPVLPASFEGDKVIQFQCRKGIECWNACCSNIDIMLTPYDIIRLKKRLGLTSTEFLQKYTYPFEFARNDIAGVKFMPVENGTACRFMRPEGCSVYEDRPTACRYYPVALLSLRRADEFTDRQQYALVQESHCKGHFEPRKLTVDEYRKEQGLEEYDEHGRAWRQLILKKKSAGPTVGNPSQRSLQLFFMASYDVDQFREFVMSPAFQDVYDIPAEEQAKWSDDLEMMDFGFRLIRQVLFNEMTIAMRPDAVERRLARKKEREAELDKIVAKLPVEEFVKPVPEEEKYDKYKFSDS
ncbi:MAG: YkgJ family cysteine cluster protein [Pseudomonadota bacterium]